MHGDLPSSVPSGSPSAFCMNPEPVPTWDLKQIGQNEMFQVRKPGRLLVRVTRWPCLTPLAASTEPQTKKIYYTWPLVFEGIHIWTTF